MAETDISSNGERDLLGNFYLLYLIVGILVGLTALYAFFWRRDKKGDYSPTITANNIGDGAVITQNQMGGQAAQKIENYGPMPRQITEASARVLVSELQKYPSEKFYIHYVGGDYEVLELAESLDSVL